MDGFLQDGGVSCFLKRFTCANDDVPKLKLSKITVWPILLRLTSDDSPLPLAPLKPACLVPAFKPDHEICRAPGGESVGGTWQRTGFNLATNVDLTARNNKRCKVCEPSRLKKVWHFPRTGGVGGRMR